MRISHYSSFINYDDYYIHLLMLCDQTRLAAYRNAIYDVVRPGMIVADVGCGTGLLGRMALEAGAKHVFMIDIEHRMINLSYLLNQHFIIDDDQVTLICADARHTELKTKVDVVLSEFIGGLVIDEEMVSVLSAFGKNNAHDESVWIPRQCSLYGALAWVPCISKPSSIQKRLSTVVSNPGAFQTIDYYQLETDPTIVSLTSKPICLWSGQGSCQHVKDIVSYTGKISTSPCQHNFFDHRLVLAAWFEAELAPGRILSNFPKNKPTHWGTALIEPKETIKFENHVPGSDYNINIAVSSEDIQLSIF